MPNLDFLDLVGREMKFDKKKVEERAYRAFW
jgi:hypothetical protein